MGDDSCSLTTEICTAEGKFFDFAKCECSTSCPALAKNEVWTNESECKRCTRGEKPKNAQEEKAIDEGIEEVKKEVRDFIE